jgi:hypothetical protein
VGQVDSKGLDDQLEVRARGVKGPGTTRLGQRQVGLVAAEQHPLVQGAVRRLVVHRDGVVPHGLGGHHANHGAGFQARHLRVLLDIFQLQHRVPMTTR